MIVALAKRMPWKWYVTENLLGEPSVTVMPANLASLGALDPGTA
ncbi:MAG: hypothetical protein WAN48_13100 [Actinomycetes bacterium]